MGTTSIEWADKVWNPVGGCTRVSPGCVNCYAEVMAARFSKPGMWGHGLAEMVGKPDGSSDHRWTGKVVEYPDRLLEPLKWRKPARIFVNSTSDLFHEGVSEPFIDKIFTVMALAKHHTFLILTKRADRMREQVNRLQHSINPLEKVARSIGYTFNFEGHSTLPWPIPNVWLGISTEDQQRFDERWPYLARTAAVKRFISYEPALGLVDFGAAMFGPVRVDQIIIGGESGPGSRRFEIQWARSALAQCRARNVACFIKQMGANPRGRAMQAMYYRDKKGGDMAEWPPDLRVREMT